MCICHTCPEHGDEQRAAEMEQRQAFGFAQQIALAEAGWYESAPEIAPDTFSDDHPEFSVGDLMAIEHKSELFYTEVQEVNQ